MIWVTKASGAKEPFDPRKVERTCVRAGASPSLAREVVKAVKGQLYDDISSARILQIVMKTLAEKKSSVAARYGLKDAMMQMGPAGFPFESFVSNLLKEYGYETQVRMKLDGRCVQHEVDVVFSAVREGRVERFIAECKYHNSPGIYTGLKEALYTHARLNDLNEAPGFTGRLRFGGAWLVSNTKLSDDAITYAKCVGLTLVGWRFPTGRGLEQMIDEKRLYPITVLSLEDKELEAFSNSELMLLKNLLERSPNYLSRFTGIPLKRIERLIEEAHTILSSI